VAVDYLACGKPLIMTDWTRSLADGRHGLPLITQAAMLLQAEQIPYIAQLITQLLQHDPCAQTRDKARLQFLGPFDSGLKQSTQAFIQAITDICQECDQLNQSNATSTLAITL
jgi:hypothetical protein